MKQFKIKFSSKNPLKYDTCTTIDSEEDRTTKPQAFVIVDPGDNFTIEEPIEDFNADLLVEEDSCKEIDLA